MLQRSRAQTSETGSDTASQAERHEAILGRKRMPHVSSMLFDLEVLSILNPRRCLLLLFKSISMYQSFDAAAVHIGFLPVHVVLPQLEDQDSGDLDHNTHSSPEASTLLKLLQPASQAEKQVTVP